MMLIFPLPLVNALLSFHAAEFPSYFLEVVADCFDSSIIARYGIMFLQVRKVVGVPIRFSKVIQGLPVQVFTDASCYPNPGQLGGWAYIIKMPGKPDIKRSGVVRGQTTTNNRMELIAAIQALSSLSEPTTLELIVDSTYLGLGITQWMSAWKKSGWRQPNADLWKKLYILDQLHTIYVTSVKGHAGCEPNEECDRLAAQATGRSSG